MTAKQRKTREVAIIVVVILAQFGLVRFFSAESDAPPPSADALRSDAAAVAAVLDPVSRPGAEDSAAASETAADVLGDVERESSITSENTSRQQTSLAPSVGQESCLEWIVYDKPVKTGSTAVKDGLVTYFATRGMEYVQCQYQTCNDAAVRILLGEDAPRSLVGHQIGDDILINALGRAGFYKVTSIREPKSRWESAFRFNRAVGGTHYGIGNDVKYAEFMERMPACSLYDYYDNLGNECGADLEKRIERIVKRYDEIIDLYDTAVGQLHKRLLPNLKISNKSPVMASEEREPFDEERLKNETLLYKALRQRRLELAGREPALC